MRFSYATDEHPLLQRTLIRAIERIGGQGKLRKLYREHQRSRRPEESFFTAAVRLLELDVRYDKALLDLTPRHGPVLFVANHPYGVLDGIALTWLAMQVRPDVKVLAIDVLCQDAEARHNLLPIDFAATQAARATVLASRLEAQSWLKEGHAIGIFPGGGVSTSEKPLRGPAIDLAWAPFTAKLIGMSRATVIPVYFVGQNSRLFQLASHLSMTLRLSLVFRETARRIGTALEVRVGRPIPYAELSGFADRRELVGELRRRTFALALSPDGRLPVPDRLLRPFGLEVYKKPLAATLAHSRRRPACG
ncbi:MAG: lysophospholipid acyltransferase family protein [Pseudomonadota bacterium]|nr:lysophospholipid acyltransferase family protein [Pseudomonadota bacterium]